MSRGRTTYLKNRESIVAHGNQSLRISAVQIVERALAAADPYARIKDNLRLEGNLLHVDKYLFDLADYENIYVLGAGKATQRIVEALEEVLGDRITAGVVVLKHGCSVDFKHVDVIYAAHPLPDENGHRGAQAMMSLAEKCTRNDLVIAGFSGGSSALLPLPVEGVTLQEKRRVHQVLLHCGADIIEINAVRKHLSRIKGGHLARTILPATILNITVSDVVGDRLDYITDPTVPDTSSFEDARRVLTKYDAWNELPRSAREYLEKGCASQETPKDFADAPIYTYLAVDGTVACTAAANQAEELGFSPMVLTTMLKGDARECGTFISSIAHEVIRFRRPLSPPCAILAAGENTVTIHGSPGEGGPNQTFVLSAALEIGGLDNIVIVSIDTDGTDGPTEFAGGIVDGSTLKRAGDANIDIVTALKEHNSTHALRALDDLLHTGHTGTNVSDLKFVLIA